MTARKRGGRQAAPRPPQRTVTVTIPEGRPFAGWSATATADFSVNSWLELKSAVAAKASPEFAAALEAIILDHNLPDANDQVAATLADVVPARGLYVIANAIFDEIAHVPNA